MKENIYVYIHREREKRTKNKVYTTKGARIENCTALLELKSEEIMKTRNDIKENVAN